MHGVFFGEIPELHSKSSELCSGSRSCVPGGSELCSEARSCVPGVRSFVLKLGVVFLESGVSF